jgi:transcriptional regulator with XRE-family HTH domain
VKEPPGVEEEVNRYRGLLRATIRAAGLSVAEVERRLEARPRLLQRIISGRRDLKLRHILSVLAVLGMEQEEFFGAAAARLEVAGRGLGLLRKMGYRGHRPELEGAGESADELQRVVDEAVEQALERREREGRLGRAEPGPETKAGNGSAGTPPRQPPEDEKPKG